MSLDEVLRLTKDVLLPIGTFFAGLFLPHVQKPLAEYRKTLADISQLMLRTVPIIYGDARRTDMSDEAEKHNAELRKFYDDVRTLHARLLSSADSIPRFARPVLQAVGLLHSRAQIEEGAKMLIGISNQVISASKDKPHLTKLIEKLGTALDITV
jgi:hypothetical protein